MTNELITILSEDKSTWPKSRSHYFTEIMTQIESNDSKPWEPGYAFSSAYLNGKEQENPFPFL